VTQAQDVYRVLLGLLAVVQSAVYVHIFGTITVLPQAQHRSTVRKE
jgi:hypothetical protein